MQIRKEYYGYIKPEQTAAVSSLAIPITSNTRELNLCHPNDYHTDFQGHLQVAKTE